MALDTPLARAGVLSALIAVAFGAFAEDHRHHLSGYVGGTTVRGLDHTGATLGVDYEYVLTPRTGIGVVAEYAAGRVDATSIFAVTDVHITRALVVQVGPGVEFIDGDALAVGRVGAYFELEFGAYTLAPSLFYDVSEREDSVVYGLIAGRRF